MKTTINNKIYTVAGITNEHTFCECCGRDNLKKTVVLVDSDGCFVYYGSDCAAKALTFTIYGKEVKVSGSTLVKNSRGYRDAAWVEFIMAQPTTRGIEVHRAAGNVTEMERLLDKRYAKAVAHFGYEFPRMRNF